MKNYIRWAAACALVLVLQPGMASSLYSNLFVIGDSLSDTGNAIIASGKVEVPPFTKVVPDYPYPYGGGRLSNGPVWVEYLAADLGLPIGPSLAGSTGYAFGTARTGPGSDPSSMLAQTGALISDFGAGLPSDALYVVFGGGNDVRDAAMVALGGDPNSAAAMVGNAVTNIGSIIGDLAAQGAEHFLVPNLPNVALTPAVQALGPTAVAGVTQLVEGFNGGLTTLINYDRSVYGLDIVALDFFSLFNDVVQNPGAYGFSNTTGMCALSNGGLGCPNPDAYVFWDGIHPTTAGHQVLGDAAFAAVVPLPAALPLFASALVVVVRPRGYR